MNDRDCNTTPTLPENVPWHVQDAFSRRFEQALPVVQSIVRRSQLNDEDFIISEVLEDVWRAFPAMYQEEQDDLAAGLPSRHNWLAFICRITRCRIIDECRRLGISPRHRPTRARRAIEDAPAPVAPAETLAQTAPSHTWEVPLHPDHIAPDDSDPAVFLERIADRIELRTNLREALAHLAWTAPRQFRALQTSLDNLPDEAAAEQLDTSRFGVYRLRQAAVLSLRRFFKERGCKVATTTPSTHP